MLFFVLSLNSLVILFYLVFGADAIHRLHDPCETKRRTFPRAPQW